MATSLRSYEARGFELTEELGVELAMRLCLPCVDAFEVDPDADSTHGLGGYAERSKVLEASVMLKAQHSALLAASEAVLLVDDIVTYGSTFAVCARRLKSAYP